MYDILFLDNLLYIFILGGDCMRIVKYKKEASGKYKIFLEDGREIFLYEEVILKFNLLLVKELDDQAILDMEEYNRKWEVYYVALNIIRRNLYSRYDLEHMLLNKEYPIAFVQLAIQKLVDQGYLDDSFYAKSYINNQMITTSNGPLKIEQDLIKKHIDSSIISKEIVAFSKEDQFVKIRKLIEKAIKCNRTRGGVILKQKIYNNLLNYGYDSFIIQSVLDTYSFKNNDHIAKKEYEKYYRKYSRTYEGEELEKKIQDKLYSKGLKYEKDDNF